MPLRAISPEGGRNGLDKASRDLTVVSSASMIAGSELGSVARGDRLSQMFDGLPRKSSVKRTKRFDFLLATLALEFG